MKKLKIAIIGQGRSGRDIHGKFFQSEANTKFDVVAIVDALPERRERAKKEFGCDVYADYKELFNRTDLDLVVNSSFSHQHASITKDLLEHGFNVVCEKPFAPNFEEGARVVLAAEKSGKMLNIFQQSRFAPYYRKIREILAGGVLGTPIQIAISFSGYARRWDWQTSLVYGGGNVRNTGPHPLDQALDLLDFDENIRVTSRLATVNTSGDAEDYAKIILDCPGKPLIDVEISSCDSFIPYTYRISCSNGCLTATMKEIKFKYFDPAEHPKKPQDLAPLCNDDGTPAYCKEKLNWKEETVSLQGSAFAGSIATTERLLQSCIQAGLPLEDVVYMMTATPAKVMGLTGKGRIAPGYDAQFTVFNKEYQVIAL